MNQSFRSPAKVLRRLRLAPVAARQVKNWPRFICNYAFGFSARKAYEFHNGARLKIGRGVDHVPIIEIFFRQDYGTIPDGAVILDLGANIGSFSVYAATTASNVRIFAYEPFADYFQLMQQNILLNNVSESVQCFQTAVSSSSQSRDLLIAGPNVLFPTLIGAEANTQRGGSNVMKVPCISLAEILDSNQLAHVDIMKMDCEGAEYEILYNTPLSYLNRIAEIRMEFHTLSGAGRNLEAMKDFLLRQGFEISLVQQGKEDNGMLWARRQ